MNISLIVILNIVKGEGYCNAKLNYNEINELQELGYKCFPKEGGTYDIEK